VRLRGGLVLAGGVLVACGVACGPSSRPPPAADPAPQDAGAGLLVRDAGGACKPPDLMIVLDRTYSMANRPDGTWPPNTPAGLDDTKWAIAVRTIDAITAAPADATIRFGLELFPHDPGGGACPTLDGVFQDQVTTNPNCQSGDVVVPVGGGSAAAIAAAIPRDTTPLCGTTPIGSALKTAADALAKIADPSRAQFVVLVTDGGENCTSDPVGVATALAASGVRLFVVGFGTTTDAGATSLDVTLLDDLACVGGTASNVRTGCVSVNGTPIAARTGGGRQFYLADSEAALAASFRGIAGSVACQVTTK